MIKINVDLVLWSFQKENLFDIKCKELGGLSFLEF